jgi:superfamily I DNA and/or RNA helicase
MRVVVAGDQQQLPPTAFFLGADEDPAPEDEYDDADLAGPAGEPPLDTGTTGFESILDVLTALLPARTLGWHYRSQDERLIAFSNVHFYDKSLLTFPACKAPSACATCAWPRPRRGWGRTRAVGRGRRGG